MRVFKLLKNRNGSIVVEASLVIPIVIFCILMIIYIAFLMCQKAFLQAQADNIAEKGAAFWNNSSKVMEIGKVRKENLNNDGLYWRLFDFKKAEKYNSIVEYVNPNSRNSILSRNSLLNSIAKDKSKRISLSVEDRIIYKKLVVNVEDTFKIPLSPKIFRYFNSKDGFTIKVKSEAIISEPAEFIRNTDFVLDTERELEEEYPEIRNLGEKTRELISGTKEDIINFFK